MVGVALNIRKSLGDPGEQPQKKVMYHRRYMGRPTQEKKEKTVKLRISEEMYEEIKGGNISETIREYIRDGIRGHKNKEGAENVPQKSISEIPSGLDNVPQNIPIGQRLVDEAIYSDIEVMCSFYGVDTATFFKELCKSMNEGEVVYEDGVIKGKSEIDLSRFMEVCHEMKKDPQEVLDRCVMMIGRL